MSTKTIYDSSQGRHDSSQGKNALGENLSLLDDILYQLSSPSMQEEMEGRFETAESLADNAYMVLSQIQELVPPEQQAEVTAEFLRESGFSSDVVAQMLEIPRDAVDAALAEAGYGPTGQPLPTSTADPTADPTDTPYLQKLLELDIPIDGDYSAEEQNLVRQGIDAGDFTVDQVADYFGIPPAIVQAVYGAPTAEEMLGSMVDADTATLVGADDESGFSLIPTTTTSTSATGSPNLVQQAGTTAGKVIDRVFQSIGLPSPTKVIGNPKPGATVVWGQTSGSPVIYTGTTPSGTQTGVTTGLPWLDAIIDKSIKTVTGQGGVPDLGQISTVVIQEAAREALGLPAGADMGQITDAINKVGQATVAATTMTGEDTEGTDLFGVDLSDDSKIADPNGRTITVNNEGQPIGPQLPTGGGDDDGKIITVNDEGPAIGPQLPTGGGDDDDDDEEIIKTIIGGEEPPPPPEEPPPPPPPGEPPPSEDGGGGTLALPPSLRGVREEPGDVVDIDYLYDFAKGLDQPFQITKENEDTKNLYMYAEGGEVANEDAVDMLTRPRRPGEYGRQYFTEGRFVPTGTALGGEALDPNAVQIPQYKYQRDAVTPQNTTTIAAPMDAISYTTAPSEDAEIDVDTLLELVGLLGMEGLGFAAGGMAQGQGQGYYLGGATDGMADLIPATIDGNQPAALSDGEFVIPADVVSHLGNGNSEAGAQQLYSMMDRVRDERTGTTKQGPEINPTKMMPA